MRSAGSEYVARLSHRILVIARSRSVKRPSTFVAGPVSLAGPADAQDLAPGEVLAAKHDVLVGTGSRPVRLGEVQAEGKRRMMASDWARGLRSGGPVRLG